MSDRARLLRELKNAEARLRTNPASADLRFTRASLLDKLGQTEHALQGYFDVLERDPKHFRALNDLGLLLFKAGQRKEARTCFESAVSHHPENAMARANLGFILMKAGEVSAARVQYEAAVALDPKNAEAHKGLSVVLATLGEENAAASHREIGFKDQFLTAVPFRGEGTPIRLLLLVSTTSGNVHTDRFIDDRIFATTKLVAEYYRPEVALPAHDLVFNALGDADVCRAGLEVACAIAARTDAPLINDPHAVLRTGRADNALRMRDLADVVAAKTALVPRAQLLGPQAADALIDQGFAFPLLLRSPGFHTGQFFEKIENAKALSARAADLPGDELLAIEFLDARSADGNVRKYRVLIIDGRFYPLHLAISDNWKIHYFSADMSENAANRTEDAAFLEDMPAVLGARAMAGLEHIRDTLALDYAGVDFSLDGEGRILLYEANATMIVRPPDPDPRWDYRRAPVERILEAARTMLQERAAVQAGVAQ